MEIKDKKLEENKKVEENIKGAPAKENIKEETTKVDVKKEENKKKEQKSDKIENKTEVLSDKVENKQENKTDNTVEKKKEVKKESKQEKNITKKEEAIVRGVSLPISKKHAMAICNLIKHKSIDQSLAELEKVSNMKKAVPFKGEIPHRKGMMSGRYPVNASIYFIKMLKSLKGNIIVNGMDLEKTRIYIASTARAFRPPKSGGRHGKRCHVLLRAKEFNLVPQKEEKK